MAIKDPTANCEGDDGRQELLNKYEVLPIARARIAEGVIIEGCCGKLTDVQVIFQIVEIAKRSNVGAISMGLHCADKLLKAMKAGGKKNAGMPMPPLSNPFVSPLVIVTPPGTPGTPGTPGAGGSSGNQAIPALNVELYNAINLWFALKGKTPQFGMLTALTLLRTNPYKDIDRKYVFEFLKVVAIWGKSLAELVASYNPKDPSRALAPQNFPLLNTIASKNWIDLP